MRPGPRSPRVGADVHTLSVGDRVLNLGVIACGQLHLLLARRPGGLSQRPDRGPRDHAGASRWPGRGHRRPRRPTPSSPRSRRHRRRGLGAGSPTSCPPATWGRCGADITPGDTGGRRRTGAGRDHGARVRRALRPGAHPRRRRRPRPPRACCLDSAPNRSTHATEGRWPPSPRPPAGRGAEAVIEAVGLDQTIIDAISMTAVTALVSVIGSTSTWRCRSHGLCLLALDHRAQHHRRHPGHMGRPHPAPRVGAASPRRHLHPPSGALRGRGTPYAMSMSGATEGAQGPARPSPLEAPSRPLAGPGRAGRGSGRSMRGARGGPSSGRSRTQGPTGAMMISVSWSTMDS